MSKKIKIIVIMALYTGLILVGTKVNAAKAIMVNETTRLRKQASTDSDIVELISIGEEVETISKEGEWYKVEYKKDGVTYTGYIREDMLKIENATQKEDNTITSENNEESKNDVQEKQTLEEPVQEINNDKQSDINIEEIQENSTIVLKNAVETKILPLINSSETGTIVANTEIKITEKIGKWYHVEAETQSGWVHESKITANIGKNKQEENTSNTEVQPKEEQEPIESKEPVKEERTENKEPVKEENTTPVEEKQQPEKVEEQAKTMYINATTVNLREKADVNSGILKQLERNTKVTVVEAGDGTWTKVNSAGEIGYISSQYLSETKNEETSRGAEEVRKPSTTENNEVTNNTKNNQEENKVEANTSQKNSTASEKTTSTSTEKKETTSSSSKNSKVSGTEIVSYAKKYLGCKYVSGGTSPKGFDCSGFTQYVYKHFGYSISRTSSEQRSNGKSVKKSELQAGDIVCFSGHVGIYIGGNEFIHAANPRKGVITTSLSNSYYVKNYVTARRIL